MKELFIKLYDCFILVFLSMIAVLGIASFIILITSLIHNNI